MSKKIFVGGLEWATTDESLRKAFEEFGEVTSATVILDRETGRSRGFGFVSFVQEDQAAAALDGMQGAQLDGRKIRVDSAVEGPGRGGGAYPRQGAGAGYGSPRGGGGDRAPRFGNVDRGRRSPVHPMMDDPPAPMWEGDEREGRGRESRRRWEKKRVGKSGRDRDGDWPPSKGGGSRRRSRDADPDDDWWED